MTTQPQQLSYFTPGHRQVPVFVVGGLFVVLTTVLVGLRLWIRTKVIARLGLDDILILLAVISTFGLTATVVIGCWFGVDQHLQTVEEVGLLVIYTKLLYASRILYLFGLMFIKMSLLAVYLRLDPRKTHRIVLYFLMFFVIGLSVPSIIVMAFSCWPANYFWNRTIDGYCVSDLQMQKFYDVNGALNIVGDVAIYVYPIPMVWSLRMSRAKKKVTCILFGMGIISVGAGCVRAVYLHELAVSPDQSWKVGEALNWCSIEVYIAIICASVPSLQAIIRRYMPGLLESSSEPDQTGFRVGSNRHVLQILSGCPREPGHHHTTVIERCSTQDSEERMMPDGMILTKTEIRLDVEEAFGNMSSTSRDPLKSG